MNFSSFPYDKHTIEAKIFLPKKDKDKVYEFVCDDHLHVKSEKVTPESMGGFGIIELKPQVAKSLHEWKICKKELVRVEGKFGTESDQTCATISLTIRRRPHYYFHKFIKVCRLLLRSAAPRAVALSPLLVHADAFSDRHACRFVDYVPR